MADKELKVKVSVDSRQGQAELKKTGQVATESARQVEQAAQSEVKNLDKVGISAKQAAAAMRGVPAQFTDIVVSLQAGQNPMSVLLQQGGQLKDMFGGAGNAVRALSGYIVSLLTPLNTALILAGGFAAAFAAGEAQSARLRKNIIASGNAAGVTAGQLEGLIQRVGEVTGNYGDARAAAEALVGSGQIGGLALEAAMKGVAAGVKVTGRDVNDLAQDFIDIGKDPVEAAKKLNTQYNFLTSAVFEQIKALQEQGRKQEAVILLSNQYADTLANRKTEIVENLGAIEKVYAGIAKFLGFIKEETLKIGREKTEDQLITDAENRLKVLRKRQEEYNQGKIGRFSPFRVSDQDVADQEKLLSSLIAARDEKRLKEQRKAEQAAKNQAEMAASASYDAFIKASLVGKAALDAQIKEIEKQRDKFVAIYGKGSDKAVEAERVAQEKIAQLKVDFAKKGQNKTGQVNALTASFALGADDLANIKQSMQASIDALRDNLALAKQVYDNAWADNQISIEGYYDARLAIVNKAADAELAANRKLLDKLEAEYVRVDVSKAVTDQDKEAKRNRLADIDRQILQVNAGIENIDRNRALATNEIANARAREKKSLDESLEALRLQNAIDTGTATAEQRAAAIRAKVTEQYAKFLNDPAAIPDIERKINIEINRDQLQVAEQEFNAALTRMRNAEDSINVQVNTKLLTEQQGREKIVALHRQTATELEKIIPLMEQAANAIGPSAVDKIGGWRNEIAKLKASANDLSTQFEGALKNSITGFFTDISSGAMSAGQAVTRFASNFLSAMAQVAAQRASTGLVDMLMGSFMSSFGGASGAAGFTGGSSGAPRGVGAFLAHTGGVIHKTALSGREVPGYVFKDAPRYHTGGIAGLKPNEVPAILMGGPKGTREEVLTADDPRHSDNLGKNQTGSTQPQNIAVGVFYTSEDAANAVLNAPNAKRLILNLASQHAAEFKSAIGA